MKKRLSILLSVILLFAMVPAVYAAGSSQSTSPKSTASNVDEADIPADLPVTVFRIGAPNQYTMVYSGYRYDEELDDMVLVFKLSDAGKLEVLMRYCCPFWQLLTKTAELKAAGAVMSSDETQAKMAVQEILNELLLNAGGGPDYRYVQRSELIETAEATVQTEEFQKFVEAAGPLAECEKTDARSLMLDFTDEELAKICDDLHEAAYGEWSLRLQWLDEMEFSLMLPASLVEETSLMDLVK